MLRTSAVAMLTAAAAFALNGCVVYATPRTHAPAAHRPAAAKAKPKPAAQTPVPAKPEPAKPAFRPPPVSRLPANPAVENAPHITAPIIFGNGTGGAFRGHAYVIPPATRRMPDLDQLVPFATLYTDSFEIQPQVFGSGFPGALRQDDWFAIRYQGFFSVPADAVYTFELISDDGALLFIDGQKVIDNDGVHGTAGITGTKELKSGNHVLRLEYFQGDRGPVSLMLNLVTKGIRTPLERRPLVGTRVRQ